MFDGRIINLRRYGVDLVPNQMSFTLTRLWVRIYGLPLAYLTHEWANQILHHVGYIEEIEQDGNELPEQAELRARMLVDLSIPLIPGCFIPIEGNRVIWVYLRYEGVFRFCKACGCVGHSTTRCNLHASVARRRVRRRLDEVEADGVRVLYGPAEYPFYSNLIRGLPDWYRFRNSEIDLLSYESRDGRFFHRRDHREDGSFEDINDPNNFSSSQEEEGSDGFHTGNENWSNEESELDQMNEGEPRQNIQLSLGRRFGLGEDPYAEFLQEGLVQPRAVINHMESLQTPMNQGINTNLETMGEMGPNLVRPTTVRGRAPFFANQPLAVQRVLFKDSSFEVGGPSNKAQTKVLGEPTRNLFDTLGISEWAANQREISRQAIESRGQAEGSEEVQRLEGNNNVIVISDDSGSLKETGEEHIDDQEFAKIMEASTILSLGIKSARRAEIKELGRIRKAVGHMPLSEDGESIRYNETDFEWVERNRLKRLHKWSEKGGFTIWLEKGKKEFKFASKAITDPDMARELGVEVDADLGEKGKKKRTQAMSTSSSGSYKRQKSEEVTSIYRETRDDMEVDFQMALDDRGWEPCD
uniref:Zinc knuckle CX2CX4HX4C domain-containing protein n=1 Tax=Chenopodium quinoa TaxID=63459 RepID=A0A803LJV4_CHEQI